MGRASRSTMSARRREPRTNGGDIPRVAPHGWLHLSVVAAAARPLSSAHPRPSLPNEKRSDLERRSRVVVRRGSGCRPTAERWPRCRVSSWRRQALPRNSARRRPHHGLLEAKRSSGIHIVQGSDRERTRKKSAGSAGLVRRIRGLRKSARGAARTHHVATQRGCAGLQWR